MAQPIDTSPQPEKAVLVALITPQQSSMQMKEHVDELSFLALTLGIQTICTFTQSVRTPHQKTLIGKGKLEEIASFVVDQQIDVVIFDDTLRPSQVRNLEGIIPCKVIDRNLLILNIFSMRAQTAQAKIQVELAQYQYLLPRLTRMWTHLSSQKGGSTGMRGPGEKELETDRRLVQKKIAHLRGKLAAIEHMCITQRKTRAQLVNVALVGYTNVGKSTLMNMLAQASVHTEDKLFATVGATTRKVVINHVPFLLTDTVGFIRKLPHTLIECFKATLHEVREADILLHVVDVSHPAYREQIQVVQTTLQEIGAADIPVILVLNKIDCIATEEALQTRIADLINHISIDQRNMVCISATKQLNSTQLRQMLFQKVYQQHMRIYPNYVQSASY
jgi:GTP-binding protein HflX